MGNTEEGRFRFTRQFSVLLVIVSEFTIQKFKGPSSSERSISQMSNRTVPIYIQGHMLYWFYYYNLKNIILKTGEWTSRLIRRSVFLPSFIGFHCDWYDQEEGGEEDGSRILVCVQGETQWEMMFKGGGGGGGLGVSCTPGGRRRNCSLCFLEVMKEEKWRKEEEGGGGGWRWC